MSGLVSGSSGGGSFRNEALEAEVAKIWLNLIRHVDDVFEGHKLGFEYILEWADPSLAKIVTQLTAVGTKVSTMLDLLTSDPEWKDLESINELINCTQAIHLVRRIHVALHSNNEDEYLSCINKLKQMVGPYSKNCPPE